jgi:ADP-L-glycero-D-manno-heptose 6-epimerase
LKNILITGSLGFIGQNMVNKLKDEFQITTFDNKVHSGIGSLNGFTHVIHLGAISNTLEKDIDKILRNNYDFSVWLLEECALKGINLQFASSAGVYGNGSEFSQTSPVDPLSPYAWSKYLFERYYEKNKHSYLKDFNVQIFRYFNVFGRYEDHKGNQSSPFHKFKKDLTEKGYVTLFKDSQFIKRDFVSVDTVVDVHRKFLDIQESGVWNIGTGTAHSFEDVARFVGATDETIRYIDMPDTLKNQYQYFTLADTSKLKRYYKFNEDFNKWHF